MAAKDSAVREGNAGGFSSEKLGVPTARLITCLALGPGRNGDPREAIAAGIAAGCGPPDDVAVESYGKAIAKQMCWPVKDTHTQTSGAPLTYVATAVRCHC